MKSYKIKWSLVTALAAACSAVAGIVPQSIPFSNGFNYTNGTPVASLTNVGWDASSPLPVVQTDVVVSATDTNAVIIPANEVVSNAISPVVLTNVWMDFYMQLAPEEVGSPAIDTNSAVTACYLDHFGHLAAYNVSSKAWETYTNYVGGGDITGVATGQWVHVSVNQNYTTRQCAIFMDGRNVRNQLPMMNNTAASCSSFSISGGEVSSSYLDDYSIQQSVPGWLNSSTNDWNSNGIPDAVEIQTVGYVGVPLYVGWSQPYTNVQAAFTAARSLDWVHIYQETVAENVSIDHTFRMITGQVFTINGNLSLGASLVMTSWVGFACGNLGVGAAGQFDVYGDVVASNVTVSTGATLLVSGSLTNLGVLTVGTNAAMTVGGNLADSGNVTVQRSGLLSVTGAVNALAFTLEDLATVWAGGNLVGTDLLMGTNAVMLVLGNMTNQNVNLGTNASLTVNGSMSSSTVALKSGAHLTAANASASGGVSLDAGAVMSVAGKLSALNAVINPSSTLSAGALALSGDVTLNSGAGLTVTGGVTAVNVNFNNAGMTATVGGTLTNLGLLTVGTNSAVAVGGNLVSSTNVTVQRAGLLSVTGSVNALAFTLEDLATARVGGNVACTDFLMGTNSLLTVNGFMSSSDITLKSWATAAVGGSLTNLGWLTVGTNASMTVGGNLVDSSNVTVQAGGLLTVNGFMNSSNVLLNLGATATVGGSLTNLGLLTVGTNGAMTVGGNLASSTNVTVQRAGLLSVTGMVNALAFTLEDGATNRVGSNLVCTTFSTGTNALLSVNGFMSSSNVTLKSGATATVGGSLTNLGLLTVGTNGAMTVGGNLASSTNVTVQRAGLLSVTGMVNALAFTLEDLATARARSNLVCTAFSTGTNAVLSVNGFMSSSNVMMNSGATAAVGGSLTNLGLLTVGTNGVMTVGGNLVDSSNVTVQAGGLLSVTGALNALAFTLEDLATGRVGGDVICTDFSTGANSIMLVLGSMTNQNVNLGTNASLTVNGSMSSSTVALKSGAHLTTGNLSATGSASLDAGAAMSVAGTMSALNAVISTGASLSAGVLALAGDLTVNTGAVLTVSGAMTAVNVNFNKGATATLGAGITATNLTLGSQVTLYIANANVVCSNLAIQSGGRIVVTNGSLTANGISLTGTFTVGDTWNSQVQSTLTFTDDFENYLNGTPLVTLGFRGWGASAGDVLVLTNLNGNTTKAVNLPYGDMVSNRVSAVGVRKVWTDVQIVMPYNIADDMPDVDNNAIAMILMSSNGYLSAYNQSVGMWEEFRTNYWGTNVAVTGLGEWVHVSVFNNFDTKECAIFRNGILLRQHLPFINTNINQYAEFGYSQMEVETGSLDNVVISGVLPAGLTNDVDQNGVADALAIDFYGDVKGGSSGTVYLLR